MKNERRKSYYQEYTPRQKQVIANFNEKIKTLDFSKISNKFMKFETDQYLKLLKELDTLKIYTFYNVNYILIEDYKNLKTVSKKNIIYQKITLNKKNIFFYKNYPQSGFFKLFTIKSIISQKLYLVNNQEPKNTFYWEQENILISQKDLNYANVPSNPIKKIKGVGRGKSKTIRVSKSFFAILDDNPNEYIHTNILLNHIYITKRTFYRWREIYGLEIIKSHIKKLNLKNFLKESDKKIIEVE
jgi:hypothetical protein